MTEYTIFGKTKDQQNEILLISEKFGIKTDIEANNIVEELKKRGCYDIRIQKVELTNDPKFWNAKLFINKY